MYIKCGAGAGRVRGGCAARTTRTGTGTGWWRRRPAAAASATTSTRCGHNTDMLIPHYAHTYTTLSHCTVQYQTVINTYLLVYYLCPQLKDNEAHNYSFMSTHLYIPTSNTDVDPRYSMSSSRNLDTPLPMMMRNELMCQ